MGFEERDALDALKKANNMLEQAIGYLTGQE